MMRVNGKKLLNLNLKGMGLGVIAGISLHLSTQLNIWCNELYSISNPTPIRKNFEKKFGYPILGMEEQIEGNPSNVLRLTRIIENEMKSKPFKLRAIKIRSDDYLKNSLSTQFHKACFVPILGTYQKNSLILKDNYYDAVAHHEIKHAKTDEIIKSEPDFYNKWKSISVNEWGNSVYFSNLEQLAFLTNGFFNLINKSVIDKEENLKLGFISNYSRFNVAEDIAELCESAERKNKILFENTNNPLILKKLHLAEEYKLIPPGFVKYSNLVNQYNNFNLSDIQTRRLEEFILQANNFIQDYPDSFYTGDIKNMKGLLLYHNSK